MNKDCIKNNVKCLECMLGTLKEEAESVELSPIKETLKGEEIKEKIYSSDEVDMPVYKCSKEKALESVVAYKAFWGKVGNAANCYCAPDTTPEEEISLEDKLERVRSAFFGSVQKPIFKKRDDTKQPTIREAFNINKY
jgi:hypothetical protein